MQSLADPIQERAMEEEAREDLITFVKDELSEADKSLKKVKDTMKWVNESKIEKAKAKLDDFSAWWQKVVSKQKTTPKHEAPAYTKEETRTKIKAVTDAVDVLLKIPKPKEKKEKKEDTKKDKKGKDKKGKKDKADEKVDTSGWDIASVEAELKKIDEQKAAAIKDEDYDKAQELKTQRTKMDKVLEALKAAPKTDGEPKVDLTGWDLAKVEEELKKNDEEKEAHGGVVA